jgi:protein-S-isoprenylcysteine O-methyltransferase Ste14
MTDLPLTLLTATTWAYWLCVGALVVRARHRTKTLSGAIPRQRLEQGMWVVWVPLVVAWAVLPCLAATSSHPLLAVPEFARDGLVAGLRWVAAVTAVACLAATIACWRRMGRNWRIAVMPHERTELVTTGLYARVRHPIYALSILLMGCSVVILPTPPMLVVAGVHCVLMIVKAHNEERFLLATHGEAYRSYCRRTGRFLPRLGQPGS